MTQEPARYGRVEGTDAVAYACEADDGDVLLTVDTKHADGERLLVDTDMIRAAAARLLVELVDAYDTTEDFKQAVRAEANRHERAGDHGLARAIEEAGL